MLPEILLFLMSSDSDIEQMRSNRLLPLQRDSVKSKIIMLMNVSATQGHLPDREASLIKKEYCRCGPHPLQVTSSRARPPLVKGAGHIGPLFPEFRGWPLWFMASIALRGLSTPAPEVVPGPHCTLRLSHLSVGGNARGPEIVSQLDM